MISTPEAKKFLAGLTVTTSNAGRDAAEVLRESLAKEAAVTVEIAARRADRNFVPGKGNHIPTAIEADLMLAKAKAASEEATRKAAQAEFAAKNRIIKPAISVSSRTVTKSVWNPATQSFEMKEVSVKAPKAEKKSAPKPNDSEKKSSNYVEVTDEMVTAMYTANSGRETQDKIFVGIKPVWNRLTKEFDQVPTIQPIVQTFPVVYGDNGSPNQMPSGRALTHLSPYLEAAKTGRQLSSGDNVVKFYAADGVLEFEAAVIPGRGQSGKTIAKHYLKEMGRLDYAVYPDVETSTDDQGKKIRTPVTRTVRRSDLMSEIPAPVVGPPVRNRAAEINVVPQEYFGPEKTVTFHCFITGTYMGKMTLRDCFHKYGTDTKQIPEHVWEANKLEKVLEKLRKQMNSAQFDILRSVLIALSKKGGGSAKVFDRVISLDCRKRSDIPSIVRRGGPIHRLTGSQRGNRALGNRHVDPRGNI